MVGAGRTIPQRPLRSRSNLDHKIFSADFVGERHLQSRFALSFSRIPTSRGEHFILFFSFLFFFFFSDRIRIKHCNLILSGKNHALNLLIVEGSRHAGVRRTATLRLRSFPLFAPYEKASLFPALSCEISAPKVQHYSIWHYEGRLRLDREQDGDG